MLLSNLKIHYHDHKSLIVNKLFPVLQFSKTLSSLQFAFSLFPELIQVNAD
jgi:hypothetical protein